MRAVVVAAGRSAKLVELPLPEPRPGEVRVRLDGCGVCGSDLPVWEGRPWFEYPREPGAPGHEGWGRVDAVGAGVEGLEPGAPVAGLAVNTLPVRSTEMVLGFPAGMPMSSTTVVHFPAASLTCK